MLSKRLIVVSVVALSALATIVPPRSAGADDRDLLRSWTAPPNVLIIMDTAATMVQDPETNAQKLLACGDDPAAKLYQAKGVLSWFVGAVPDFNFGFTYLEKKDVNIRYLNYVYRVMDGVDTNGDGTIDLTQRTMLDGTLVGADIRMGARIDPWHSTAATPIYPIRYGMRGEDCYPDADCRYLPSKPKVGDVYLRSYLIDAGGSRKGTSAPFYYPAYDWSTIDPTVESAMLGTVGWNTVALARGISTSSATWKRDLHDQLVNTDGTLSSSVATQIGSRVLRIKEEKWVAEAQGNGAAWELEQTQVTWVRFVRYFVLYDRPNTDSDASQVSSAHGTLTSVDWEAPGNDCQGYLDTGSNNLPIVEMLPPDATTGLIDSSLQAYHISEVRSYLQPQTTPIFYFPTRQQAPYYLPNGREAWMPFTETAVAGGRRDLKGSLNEVSAYMNDVVRTRPDPLRDCRKDFVILITDGLENCASSTNPLCNQATQLGNQKIPVFVIGFGPAAMFNGQSSFTCIANNSGGKAFMASNAAQLREELTKIGRIIKERLAAFASPAVPSVELTTREKGYISTFYSVRDRSVWEGHLRAYLVDQNTGVVPTTCQTDANGKQLCFPDTTQALWDAGEILATTLPSARNMFFGTNSSSGVPGTRTAFTVTSSTEVPLYNRIFETNLTSLTTAQRTELGTVVGFTRGDRGAIDNNGDGTPDYRFCYDPQICDISGAVGKLGAIFHSVPVVAGRPDCFACFHQTLGDYQAFYAKHTWRRKVLFVGANDGAVHAFDAGFYVAPHTDAQGNPVPAEYDDGNGKELFAWVPNGVMPTLDTSAETTTNVYSVDGSPTEVDVYIDPQHTGTPNPADRQWRSVVLIGDRSGGNGLLALDVTTPDPVNATTHVPTSGTNRAPGCLDGSSASCDGAYPSVLWEFKDTGTDGYGNPDLGQTWSKPAVGIVPVQPSGSSTTPEYRFVAVFGGGYEPINTQPDGTKTYGGDYLYMVDIETGKTLLKLPTTGSVPGEVGLLDANFDGVIERVYWTDTAGDIWRLKINTAADYQTSGTSAGQVVCTFSDVNTASCGTGWAVKKLFSPGASAGYQPLFHRPTIVLAGFSGDGSPVYAVSVGSGDREDILSFNSPVHRFYTVLDPGTDTGLPYSEANLQAIDVNTATSAPAGTNYLFGSTHGWYLTLHDYEKVNTAAVAVEGQLVFSTFTPTTDIQPEPQINPATGKAEIVCYRKGNARTYVVDYLNGNPGLGMTDRFLAMRDDVLMVSEPVVYVGEDGRLHILQTTDNLAVYEPVAPQAVRGAMVSWRER